MELMEYTPVIGLEVHCQLKTDSKLFCACRNEPMGAVNRHVCPVCLGFPGALPVLNEAAVINAIRLALALKMDVNPVWRFVRKNYFYPDLPKGYQITMLDQPVGQNGVLKWHREGRAGQLRIQRIHLEEDAGRLIHNEPFCPETQSLVDYNRAGVPLIELVTEPELTSAQAVVDLLVCYRSMLQILSISDAEMDKGNLRVDVNVSIQSGDRVSQPVEIKNLNSYRAIKKAVSAELLRQKSLLHQRSRNQRETLRFDPVSQKTQSIRLKEGSADYKFFIEPDIPPVCVTESMIDRCRSDIPLLPQDRFERLRGELNLPVETCDYLTYHPDTYDYFSRCAKLFPDVQLLARWLMQDFRSSQSSFPSQALPEPHEFCHLLHSVSKKGLPSGLAKEILMETFRSGLPITQLMRKERYQAISDPVKIQALLHDLFARYPHKARAFSGGQHNLQGFFLKEMRKITSNRVDPRQVIRLLRNAITQKNHIPGYDGTRDV